MSNLKRWLLIGVTSGLVVILLVSVLTILPALAQGPMRGYGPGRMMMGGYGFNGQSGYGPGWMHGGGMPGGYGFNGQPGCGGGGMLRGGMWGGNSPFFAAGTPLTVAEATDAVNTYLATLNDANLELAEVMIFDNHAYAEIMEKDSGIGAMELLVDPQTKTVTPEMGPNMMWNQKYGMMAGYDGWGRWGGNAAPNATSAEMSVTPAQAVTAAQTYLDDAFNGAFTAGEEAEAFYGYYTLHVNQNGETVGMLSVNGYTGQVFLHTWHGKLLEMSEME